MDTNLTSSLGEELAAKERKERKVRRADFQPAATQVLA
jgi:hypothetical protein